MDYTKPWLTVDEQIERLVNNGIEVKNRDRASALLQSIGYSRLTGHLYPFRESEQYLDDKDRSRTRVLSHYQTGTTLQHADEIVNFDRRLRMLVMEGIEHIEIAVRMRIGYVLGRSSALGLLTGFRAGSAAVAHALCRSITSIDR